ncbi:hypothetical protein LMH87_000257 [Akanthomyces muscarius]|uniref:Uncharacterized protein n=1 Tax=Akanthomyces muscarius TaxID=2231603 RepID=A0A9W8UME6_AKAMU|nr:hypothetical protein LMH87_000257 [Akanthomyces muscarius]KAJ4154987.1 hypothetical protein LMH87_000257 [Akanthomyces muscarius]
MASLDMPDAPAGLFTLPWEVRRPIIVQVLPHGRAKLPCFDDKLIKSRVRLRNCFDGAYPGITNFYVSRRRNRCFHGHGLRATNRQLRRETALVIDEELKSGRMDVPFVLDIMLVRDIGVFPSWMSFPYRPEHIQQLTVNIRIVRPGTISIPDEWAEMARYEDNSDSCSLSTSWHLLLGITYYAFGCFSVKQDPALPRVDPAGQQATRQDALLADRENARVAEVQTAGPLGGKKKTKPGTTQPGETKQGKGRQPDVRFPKKKNPKWVHPDFVNHRSDTFDAYRLPSASYVTDELVIGFAKFECDVDNKPIPLPPKAKGFCISPWTPIPPGTFEARKESRFYQEGCIQFSRDLFQDYSSKGLDFSETEEELHLIFDGTYTSYQVYCALVSAIYRMASPEVFTSELAPYLQLLAHSTGAISTDGPLVGERGLISQSPLEWTYTEDGWGADRQDFKIEAIERNLAKELARDVPDEEHLVQLRILQARYNHGWILPEA